MIQVLLSLAFVVVLARPIPSIPTTIEFSFNTNEEQEIHFWSDAANYRLDTNDVKRWCTRNGAYEFRSNSLDACAIDCFNGTFCPESPTNCTKCHCDQTFLSQAMMDWIFGALNYTTSTGKACGGTPEGSNLFYLRNETGVNSYAEYFYCFNGQVPAYFRRYTHQESGNLRSMVLCLFVCCPCGCCCCCCCCCC
jgi:hypothetical protein